MICKFAQYEHSRIGFPKVILKWTIEDGKMGDAYWTLHGIIQYPWRWENQYPMPFIQHELKQFDKWVGERFEDDITVQG